MKLRKLFSFVAISGSIASFVCAAPPTPINVVQVQPNSLFRDDAVLQRGIALPVWGSAPTGTQVTVEFAGQRVSALAQNEKWMVSLRPLTASDQPRPMVISSRTGTLTLKNIVVGDVWLASGQSNMERQLGPRPGQPELVHWKEEAASAHYPLIRQYYVSQNVSDEAAADVHGTWTVCTPTTAPDFTAVGYYFARDLYKAERIPIGIIHSSWGGTPAQAWISPEALKTVPQFKSFVPRSANPAAPAPATATPQYLPTLCFNAMIAPLIPFPIRGVIWYQGEANASDGKGYRTLFPAVIADWRKRWKLGDFPFLFVQIAPHVNMTPEIREAQLLTLAKVPATAMAVTVDVGAPNNIHPPNKEPVGKRLALAARALAGGERIEYSGPLYDSMTFFMNKVTLKFTHTGTGLMAKGGSLKGFTIAGRDKNFVPAEAAISGNTVLVSSKAVAQPTAVRYGWENVPDVNLFNKEGLPASPFRTDVE